MAAPQYSKAQSIDFGSETCTQDYALYDYYSNGEYVGSAWEPDGITCYPNGGSPTEYDPGWIDQPAPEPGEETAQAGIWVQVADTEVNVIKNQVRTSKLACYEGQNESQGHAEMKLLAASRILIKNPNLKATTIVTVFFNDGKKQTFQRAHPLASSAFQMTPTSGCISFG